jgi:hypothetical protein
MERIILQIYGSIEIMGISMMFMGEHLMHHNAVFKLPFILYGMGWAIAILCPALYLLRKIDNVDGEK